MMRALTLTAFFALAIAPARVGFAAGTAAIAQSEDVARAKTHYLAGESYYAQKMYADAAKQFEEAYRLSRRAALLYNIGKAHDAGGDVVRALKAYRGYLNQAPTASDAQEVKRRVDEIAKLTAHVAIVSNVDGAQVRFDGDDTGTTPLPSATLEVNPGRHTIEVTHAAYTPFRRELDAEPGARIEVKVELSAPKAAVTTIAPAQRAVALAPKQPVYKKWWFWTAIVGGAAVVATGVALGVTLGASGDNTPTVPFPPLQ